MKIELNDASGKMIISTDYLDNDNYVEVTVNDSTVEIGIEELFAASKAFYEMRERAKKWDNLL